jgi:octaprenyl-diphosphate synthase
VLDYTGDEATLGKQPGTDLRARKITLPLLVLRDRMAPIGGLPAGPHDFDAIRELMARHGVAEDCLARARTHRDRALDALSALPPSSGRDELAALADRFVARSR